MSSRPFLLGVHREDGHSPGHEDDDAAILQATAATLHQREHRVRLCRPESIARELAAGPTLVFAMCETPCYLAKLDRAAAKGVPVFNRPHGIRNTYRHRMIRELAAAPISFPHSDIVTLTENPRWPQRPVWLKRYDYHATEADDVLFADSRARWDAAIESFAARGFARAVVQDHVAGDLIKFYGVANRWFRWFYHQNQVLAGHAFDAAALVRVAQSAAAALGVDIFGGDVIVGADQALTVIDLNAWPSYARFRAEAGAAIAEFIETRLAARPQAAPAPVM